MYEHEYYQSAPDEQVFYQTSREFWSGVSEDLKAQRERQNSVGVDISTGVHEILEELGVDLSLLPTRDEPELPRRARMRSGQHQMHRDTH